MIGHIYIIRSTNTDNVYIGSTTKRPAIRFNKHQSTYRNGTSTTRATEVLKHGGCIFQVLETGEFETRRGLRVKEDEWISLFPNAVNEAKAQSPTGVDIYCHACGHTIRKSDKTRHTAFPKHQKNLFKQLPL